MTMRGDRNASHRHRGTAGLARGSGAGGVHLSLSGRRDLLGRDRLLRLHDGRGGAAAGGPDRGIARDVPRSGRRGGGQRRADDPARHPAGAAQFHRRNVAVERSFALRPVRLCL